MPAVIIEPYNLATFSNASASLPDTIFKILVSVFILSPGFIRSGEYPNLKSVPTFNP